MIDPHLDRANSDSRLTPTDRRVLAICHKYLNGYKPRSIKRGTIKRELGYKTSSGAQPVTLSLRKLLSLGYLIQGPDDERLRTYVLSSPTGEGPKLGPNQAA